MLKGDQENRAETFRAGRDEVLPWEVTGTGEFDLGGGVGDVRLD